jgi:hypothetical protein
MRARQTAISFQGHGSTTTGQEKASAQCQLLLATEHRMVLRKYWHEGMTVDAAADQKW